MSRYPGNGSRVRGYVPPRLNVVDLGLPRFASFGLGVGRSSGRGGFSGSFGFGFLQFFKSGLDASQVGPKMKHVVDQGGQQFLNPRGGRL